MLALLNPVRLMIAGTVSPDFAQVSDLFYSVVRQLALAPELTPRSFALAIPSI